MRETGSNNSPTRQIARRGREIESALEIFSVGRVSASDTVAGTLAGALFELFQTFFSLFSHDAVRSLQKTDTARC